MIIGITSGSIVIIHIPNVFNPISTSSAASVSIFIQTTIARLTTQTYSNTYSLSLAIPNAISKNPNNDNGVGGISTNYASIFHPTSVNSVTWTDIYVSPGAGRSVAASNGIILMFPSLPASNPQAYILPKTGLTCSIGLSLPQTCFAYPEVGWVVVQGLTQNFNSGIQNTLILKGMKTPFYAAAPKGGLTIITTKSGAELENITYTSFPPYTAGSVNNVGIIGSNYQSLQVNVEYNWTFTFTNNIPAGGLIVLKFPPNWFNLNSNPLPVGTVISGITSTSLTTNTITFSYNNNIVTISGFSPYVGGTPIHIILMGVKNPSTTGLSSYFEIDSYTAENNIIDQNAILPGITILKQQTTGQVIFNYFYTTPWNGRLRGNYYLSFYPSVNYPALATMNIVFPATEFTSASFVNLGTQKCSISGAITTMLSCTLTALIGTFIITLNSPMIMNANMLPINIIFPHIINFNSELSSGDIIVRVVYDGIVLDQAGTTDTNRKAITGVLSATLGYSSFSFVPKTEGQYATYSVTLKPPASFNSNALIQFEFPHQFPRGLGGLGGTIACQSSIQITNVPLNCAVQDWIINITNHNGFQYSTAGFQVNIKGIINPNSAPALTEGIAVFIFDTQNNVLCYTLTLGVLTYTTAPKVLYVNQFSVSAAQTRISATYNWQISPTITTTAPSVLSVFFTGSFLIQYLSPNATFSLAGGSQLVSTTFLNFVSVNFPAAITTSTLYSFSVNGITNPQDPGQQLYPVIYLLDTTAQIITVRSYANLIQPPNLSFVHAGLMIILNNDVPTNIIQGQSKLYTFVFPNTVTQNYTLVSSTSLSAIITSSVTIATGQKQVSVWIGIQPNTPTQLAYIIWTLQGDTGGTYWKIRPLAINVVYTTSQIQLTTFNSIPAGGRTGPIYVTLATSPTSNLILQVYQLGTVPTEINIYPNILRYSQGVTSQQFWISAGLHSTGVRGSILFLINGTDKNSYSMNSQIINFTIINANSTSTQLISSSLDVISENYITLTIAASQRCTIYFFIVPQGTLQPNFNDIKNKTMRYDYYGGEYIVGEYVNENITNVWNFNITGLRSSTDYSATIYIEDFNGIVANLMSPILYNFTTLDDCPQLITIPMKTAISSETDQLDMVKSIALFANINSGRIELNFSNMIKPEGSTTTLNMNITKGQNGRVNKNITNQVQEKGSFSFILFPDFSNPFAPSVTQTISNLQSNLNLLDSYCK